MTTLEFNAKLKKANSLKALIKLRNETNASRWIARIKEKIEKVLLKRGFQSVTISATSLQKYFHPYAGSHAKFKMENSRKLSHFNNQKVEVYVNHRHGSKFSMCDIFIK
jgi:hypothetical protein